jgi:signal peptidase I
MGDNRPVSLDSRIFGTITKKQIVGRAWLRVWPFADFEHFTTPVY